MKIQIRDAFLWAIAFGEIICFNDVVTHSTTSLGYIIARGYCDSLTGTL